MKPVFLKLTRFHWLEQRPVGPTWINMNLVGQMYRIRSENQNEWTHVEYVAVSDENNMVERVCETPEQIMALIDEVTQ